MQELPQVFRVRQLFEGSAIEDVGQKVKEELLSLNLNSKIQPGQTVAITAGSRGISNIALIVKSICEHVRSLEAIPIIIPAMGSHGGATADGQRNIVEKYGITEDYTGAEIRSSLKTVTVDKTKQGIPVFFDKNAFEADHVIICNRVKAHTTFVGEIESGLHKMMLIGLGKNEGAQYYHKAIQVFSFGEIIDDVADIVLEKCNIVAGLAIVENGYDETSIIEGVQPSDFRNREKELLIQSKSFMPRLPFDKTGLLIIDELGKDISGSGIDTNIIGRKFYSHQASEKDDVSCHRIFVRGLTKETNGNACGIGLAEFTNQRTVDEIDFHTTNINVVTAGHPAAGMIPLVFQTDREAIDAAMKSMPLGAANNVELMQISNTLHLSELYLSQTYLPWMEGRADLEILSEPDEMEFDTEGNLLPVKR